MLVMFYVATSFPFLEIPIYMRLTMCSAILVLPFSCIIVPILFPLYKFINACNVAMIVRLLFFNIIPIVMTPFPIMNFFLCSALMPVSIY